MNLAVRRCLLAFLIAGLVPGAVCWFVWQDMQKSMNRPLGVKSPVIFEIAPGSPIATIGTQLVSRGWLVHREYLRLEMEFNHRGKSLQAGAYEILPGQSLRELLEQAVAGRIKQYSVTLPEGISVTELRRILTTLPGLKPSMQELSDGALMQELGLANRAAEGRFFPSTYFYKHNTTDRELLIRMNQQLELVLQRAWTARAADLPYDNPDQALIMASIIERETGVAAERPQIAGVFVRRLKLGMKLQTDPTVIYGIGNDFDGNLRRADLERDTPYNTYTRAGLPPTAICLPGKEAIEAALNPAAGDSLYFVARGDGRHVFSNTLAEHNAAVREFQMAKDPR